MGSLWRSRVVPALLPMVLFLLVGLSSAQGRFDLADLGLECSVCNEAHTESGITCTWRGQPEESYRAWFKITKNAQGRCPPELTEWQPCNATSENSCRIPFHKCSDPYHDTYYVLVNSTSMLYQTINFAKPDIVKPDPPENLRISAVGSRDLTIGWEMPRCAEVPYTTYVCAIQYKSLRDNRTREKDQIMVEQPNPQSEKIGSLVPNTRYLVRLQCRQTIGELWSEYSPYLEVKTRESAPASGPVVRTPENSWEDYRLGLRNVTLRWEALDPNKWNAEALGGYLINVTDQRTQESVDFDITASSQNLYTFTLANLKLSGYRVEVFSYNNEGLSPPTVLQLQDISARPDQPQNVIASFNSDEDILLSWQPPSAIGGIEEYFVSWCTVESDRQCAGEGNETRVPGSQLSVTLQDSWVPYVRYGFVVVASTSAGRGEPSSTVYLYSVEGAPSSPPQNVMVQAETATSLLVEWNAPPVQDRRGVITTYRVYYYITPSVSGQQMATDVVFTSVDVTDDAKPVQFSLRGLEPFTDYSVRVSAVTSQGEGNKSDPVSARTKQAAPSDEPSNVRISNVTVDTMVISWSPPSQPNGIIQGYTVHYGNGSMPVGDQTEVILEGLEGDTEYPVRVQACSGAVENPCGPLSPVENVRTKIGVPGIPMNLKVAFDEYQEKVHILWDPPVPRNAHDITYTIEYYREDDDQVFIKETTETELLLDKSVVNCRLGQSFVFSVEARPTDQSDLPGKRSPNEYLSCDALPPAFHSSQPEPVSLTTAAIAGCIIAVVLFGLCLAVSGPKIHKRFRKMKGYESQLPGPKNYFTEEGTYYSVPGDSFMSPSSMQNPYVISDSGMDKETVDDISVLKKLGRQWSHDSAIGLDSGEGNIVVDVPGKSAHYSTASSSSGCSDGSEESLLPQNEQGVVETEVEAEKGDVVWEKRDRAASTNTTSSHGSTEQGSDVAEYSKVAAVGGKFRDLNIDYVPKVGEKEKNGPKGDVPSKAVEAKTVDERKDMVNLDPSKLVSVHPSLDLSPDQVKHRIIDPEKIVYVANETACAVAEV